MRAVFLTLTAFALLAPATAEARFKFRMSRPAPAAKPTMAPPAPIRAPAAAAARPTTGRPGVIFFSTGAASQAAAAPASDPNARSQIAQPSAAPIIPAAAASTGVAPQRMGEASRRTTDATPGFKVVY